jgi:hypothetical protein
MKRKVQNIRIDIKEVEERNQLANEIKSLLPQITDQVHMKAALTLNCEYKVISGYLAGDIADMAVARQLINLLRAIIDWQNNGSIEQAPKEEVSYINLVEFLFRAYRMSSTITEKLEQIDKSINENSRQLQTSLNEACGDKLILKIATLSDKTFRKCESIGAQLNFLEKKMGENIQRIQMTVNEMYYKLHELTSSK